MNWIMNSLNPEKDIVTIKSHRPAWVIVQGDPVSRFPDRVSMEDLKHWGVVGLYEGGKV